MKASVDIPVDVSNASLDGLAGGLIGILIWALIGIGVLWLTSFFAEGALQKLRPVAVFLLIAGLVGFLGLRALNGSV